MATSVGNWNSKTKVGHEVTLPSGNVCRVIRPGMEELIEVGVLPDSLIPIAMEAVSAAKKPGVPQDRKKKKDDSPEEGLSPELMEKFLKNDNALVEMFESFSRATALCVVEPPVRYHKRERTTDSGVLMKDDTGKVLWETIPLPARDPEYLYTDMIDQDDKAFLFQYVVGGDSNLEKFREGLGDAVATVHDGPAVSLPTE